MNKMPRKNVSSNTPANIPAAAALYTNQQLPGIGASLGLDRLLAGMEELGLLPKVATPAEIFIPYFDAARLHDYLRLAAQLRAAGFGVALTAVVTFLFGLAPALRASGVTIILTTHYIEEAEDMADRVGVMSNGELILVEEKNELMRKLGKKQLALHLQKPLAAIPDALAAHHLTLADDGSELIYTYDTQGERTGITALLHDLGEAGVRFKDLNTTQSSLEDIFVGLVSRKAEAGK
jgi:uncharacterized protein YlzI (FlbEa/FlbD family)